MCTYHQGNTLLVSDPGDGLEIRHVVARVSDGLDVDGLGAVINGRSQVLRLVTLDKLGLDAKAGQQDLELVVSTAVQVAGSDDVIAGVSKGRDGEKLCRLAGRRSDGGNTAFEGSNTLLEDIDGRLVVSHGQIVRTEPSGLNHSRS